MLYAAVVTLGSLPSVALSSTTALHRYYNMQLPQSDKSIKST
jgi:hypothetical protein